MFRNEESYFQIKYTSSLLIISDPLTHLCRDKLLHTTSQMREMVSELEEHLKSEASNSKENKHSI